MYGCEGMACMVMQVVVMWSLLIYVSHEDNHSTVQYIYNTDEKINKYFSSPFHNSHCLISSRSIRGSRSSLGRNY